MTEKTETKIADRLFLDEDEPDADIVIAMARNELVAGLRSRGVPHARVRWDDYDWSVEIYDVPAEWRMSPEIQRWLIEQGFVQAYMNHVDHWETHYSFWLNGEFAVRPGWRVSYPHRRPDSDGQIWVEKIVPSWPREWFRRPRWQFWRRRRGPSVAMKRSKE